MTYKRTRRIEYTALYDGTCDDNLKSQGISTSIRVQLRKRLGLVCIVKDGQEIPIILTQRLVKGERYCIYLEDNDIPHIPVCDRPIHIVYEDEDLAVIDKPYGLAVIPTHNHYGKCLANCLANIWGDFVYRPVNRLDRDTSGLMIVAKNSLAHSLLTGNTHREYLALCSGIFEGNKCGTIDKPIARVDSGMMRCVRADGDRAITHYEVQKQYEEYFLCKFVLDTGRTHQIRVHTSYMGYPLCCDKMYNPNAKAIVAPNNQVLDRQALHSYLLRFTHPISGQKLEFVSKPEFL